MLRRLCILLQILAVASMDGYHGNSAEMSSSPSYSTTGFAEGSYSEVPSPAPSLSPALLPLVPYPQSLVLDDECAPAVIDPLTFLFASNTPSLLLDKVTLCNLSRNHIHIS